MKIKSEFYSNKGKELLTLTGYMEVYSFRYIMGDFDVDTNELKKRIDNMETNSGSMALDKIIDNLLEFGSKIFVEGNEKEKRLLIMRLLLKK